MILTLSSAEVVPDAKLAAFLVQGLASAQNYVSINKVRECFAHFSAVTGDDMAEGAYAEGREE